METASLNTAKDTVSRLLEQKGTVFYEEAIQFPNLSTDQIVKYEESNFITNLETFLPFGFNQEINDLLDRQVKLTLSTNAPSEYINLFLATYSRYRDTYDDNTKLLIMAFILMLMDRTKTFKKVFTSENINLLFNEFYFPLDPTVRCRYHYIQNVNRVLYNWLISSTREEQDLIYKEIDKYCFISKSADREKTIYNFLPMISFLLKNYEITHFYSVFTELRFFEPFLIKAQNDLVLFDIFRTMIRTCPKQALANNAILTRMPFYFISSNVQSQYKEVIDCAVNALIICSSDLNRQNEEENLVLSIKLILIFDNILMQLLKSLSENKTNKTIINKIKIVQDAIMETFPYFLNVKLVHHLIDDSQILQRMAELSVISGQMFTFFLTFLLKMSEIYYDFLNAITTDNKFDQKIFKVLKKFKPNKEEKLPDLTLFYDFVFCGNLVGEDENANNEGNNNEEKKEKEELVPFIKNYKGIELLLNFIPILENGTETEVSTFLINMLNNNANNLELIRASVPEFILNRLKVLSKGNKEKEETVQNYLTLFEKLIHTEFNISLFYRMIELMKEQSYEYSFELIHMLKNLLDSNITENNNNDSTCSDEPESFFRLNDWNGCGLFGPTLKNEPGKDFSINFRIRFNDKFNFKKPSDRLPLFFGETTPQKSSSSSLTTIRIGFEIDSNGSIFFVEDVLENLISIPSKRKEVLVLEFKESENSFLEVNKWRNIQIFFSKTLFKHSIQLCIDSSEIQTFSPSNWIFNSEFILYFGAKSPPPKSFIENYQSTICDISTIYILNGSDHLSPTQLYSKGSKNTIKNIICCLNPSNGHYGFCYDINGGKSYIEYKGNTIPFITKVGDVIQNVSFILNILPLFEHREIKDYKIFGNSHYRSDPDKGRIFKKEEISIKGTIHFLINIIDIFIKMILVSQKTITMFIERQFIELMSSFLSGIDPTIIKEIVNDELIDKLIDFYHTIEENNELRHQISQYLLFNYTFFLKLDEKVRENYFTNKLTKLLTEREDMYHFSIIPSVIHQTFNSFHEQSPTSDSVWSILTFMLHRSIGDVIIIMKDKKLSYSYLISIIKYLLSFKSTYVTIQCLQLLLTLIKSKDVIAYNKANDTSIENSGGNNSNGSNKEKAETIVTEVLGSVVKSCLKKKSVFNTFIESMGQPSTIIQILSIKIIHKLRAFFDMHKVVYQCSTALKECNDDINDLTFEVFSKLIVYEKKYDDIKAKVKTSNVARINADYLKLLVKCCQLSDDQETTKQVCLDLNDAFAVNPEEAIKILSIPCWAELITDLYTLVFDPVSESQMFSIPFTFLFETEFRKFNSDYIKHYFLYLHLTKIKDIRKTKLCILSSLLHGSNITNEQISAIFPIVFDYLLFEKSVKKDKGGNLSDNFKMIDTSENNYQLNDNEIELIDSLISLSSGITLKEVLIEDSMKLNSSIALSILVSNLFRPSKKEGEDKIIENLRTLSEKIMANLTKNKVSDQVKSICAQCASLILAVVPKENELIKNKFTFLSNYITSDENNIMENFIRNFPKFQAEFLININNVSNICKQDSDSCIESDETQQNDMNETAVLADSFWNFKSNGKNSYNNQNFLNQQDRKFINEFRHLLKIRKSFLTTISEYPGPWVNKYSKTSPDDRKFKAFNFISRNGQRILMKINSKFDDHSDATKNTILKYDNKEAKFDEDDEREANKRKDKVKYKPIIKIDEFYEKSGTFSTKLFKSYQIDGIDGQIVHTDKYIIFSSSNKIIRIKISKVLFILNRFIGKHDNCCEIFTNDYRSYLLQFGDNKEREQFYSSLDKMNINSRDIYRNYCYNNNSPNSGGFLGINFSRFYGNNNDNKFEKVDFFNLLRLKCNGCIHQNKSSSILLSEIKLDKLWQDHKITNFEYIYYLNLLSGRSYNNINQYPIFPFLIKECNNEKIDLTDPNVYRNLGLIPAQLNQESLLRKYTESIQINDPILQSIIHECPSSNFLTCHYLFKVEPFTSMHIEIQTGKSEKRFDHPGRQFVSIPLNWQRLFQGLHIEGISEFFTFPYMLLNENHFNFGNRDMEPLDINDTILPAWAKRNPYVHTFVNRIALESEYVSQHLHEWIDLYFGPNRGYIEAPKMPTSEEEGENNKNKKKGKEELVNVYPLSTYPEKLNDNDTSIIGCLPTILFDKPHVKRNPLPFINTNNCCLNSSTSSEPARVQQSTFKVQQLKKKSEVLKIIKNIVQCRDSYLLDYLSPSMTTTTSTTKDKATSQQITVSTTSVGPPIDISLPSSAGCGDLCGVSRCFGIAVFISSVDPFVTVVNLNTKTSKTECHSSSLITCASIVGGRYILTGGNDCSINVWEIAHRDNNSNNDNNNNNSNDNENSLANSVVDSNGNIFVRLISSSGFHADEIVAAGGCYSNGLIVSLDKKNNLVFETLLSHIFINSVLVENAAESGEKVNKEILVYKSGIVVVALNKTVLFFDSHGKEIHRISLCGNLIEIRKYYDFDTRELLLIGYEKDHLDIFDLTTFQLIVQFVAPNLHFCPLKKSRALIVSNVYDINVYSFDRRIPNEIEIVEKQNMKPVLINIES